MERFYHDVYGGDSLEGSELTQCLQRAGELLDRYEREFTVTEAVQNGRKLAICAMADVLGYFTNAQNGAGGLRYASVGTVSVSGKGIYGALDISPRAQERELYRTACIYLDICRAVRSDDYPSGASRHLP